MHVYAGLQYQQTYSLVASRHGMCNVQLQPPWIVSDSMNVASVCSVRCAALLHMRALSS
jgi:hypothetical protein